jgi:FKBP-type peptidyl-prolyl cis-trans isomerase
MSNAKLIGGFVVGAVVGGVVATSMTQQAAGPAVADQAVVLLETDKQKSSYVIGTDIGGRFLSQEMDIDQGALAAGIEDAMVGNEPRMGEEEARAVIAKLVEEQQARQAEQQQAAQVEREAQAEKNRAEGEAFLAENKSKEGVVTTDSGLQYKVVVEGDGEKPTAENTVQVHYRGTLIDGTEFDSSYSRGEPAQFQVNRVIAGWTEALQLMNEGSKWELYIPSDLAYGSRGAGSNIGPDAVLIFEVELLKSST